MRNLPICIVFGILMPSMLGCDDPPRPRQSAIDGASDDVREDVRRRREQTDNRETDSQSAERQNVPTKRPEAGKRGTTLADQEEDDKDAQADRPTSPDNE